MIAKIELIGSTFLFLVNIAKKKVNQNILEKKKKKKKIQTSLRIFLCQSANRLKYPKKKKKKKKKKKEKKKKKNRRLKKISNFYDSHWLD